MKITDVRVETTSIKSQIRNSIIDFSQMTVSVAAVVSDVIRDGRPLVGYGFNSNGRYGQTGMLRERFVPRLLAEPAECLLDASHENLDPAKAWSAVMTNEKPGGHGERSVAVGVIDMALWDLVAKIADQPLHRLLAERYGDGTVDEQVYVYAAGGYYHPGKGLTALQDEMSEYLDQGYSTVKMKIGGASLTEDLERIEAVLNVVGDGQRLMVDANGRFDVQTALRYAEALSPYDLLWYEEAGDPLDYALQAQVSAAYDGAMATGENLFSTQDAVNLVRYGGLNCERDTLQMDPALSYGLVEYLRTIELLGERGWSTRRFIPHGGHQMALSIAAGLHLGGNESYPGLFQPFGGFADETPVVDGRVRVPDVPGIGFESKSALINELKRLTAT